MNSSNWVVRLESQASWEVGALVLMMSFWMIWCCEFEMPLAMGGCMVDEAR